MVRVAERDRERYRFTVGEASLLEAVVEAVAFVTDADPLALDPLGEAVDPDALERLVASSDAVAVSFDVEGVRVTVRGSGEIELAAPAPEGTINTDLEGVSHVLLLGAAGDGCCHEHLSGFPADRTDLISVQTSRPADAVLREWSPNRPATAAVLEVGGSVRSAAATPPVGTSAVTVEPVDDLGAIGGRVSERLADRAGAPSRPAVCVDSLEDLVAEHGVKQVFMFLQRVLSRVRKAGGIAHAHLDPSAVDELDRYTLEALFDAVVGPDADGEPTVRRD